MNKNVGTLLTLTLTYLTIREIVIIIYNVKYNKIAREMINDIDKILSGE